MRFYLGANEPSWLRRADVDLFVSRRRLGRLKSLPRAAGRWALDSGGFSELSLFGRWETPAARYAEESQRYREEVGGLEWAAIQDWMCEPFMIERTGKSVAEHQELTVANCLDLAALAPGFPWAPVLQGWGIDDYFRHAEMYRSAGVDLAAAPVVGVGSVCRRQSTVFAAELFANLSTLGLPLHAFGVKTSGLKIFGWALTSSDSMAWSKKARKNPPLEGCDHKRCNHCLKYAMAWRRRVLKMTERPQQARFGW